MGNNQQTSENNVVQNSSIKDALESITFIENNSQLPFILGARDNNFVVRDLNEMGHLLIGGATGQGKTNYLHSLICALLTKKHFEDLKLILMDSKKSEFSIYKKLEDKYLYKFDNIPSILSDTAQISTALELLNEEVNRRLALIYQANKKNITDYKVDSNNEKLPFIIVIINELADIVIGDDDAKNLLHSLTQKGHVVGIHLVIATNRPSYDVLTGRLKTNLPARIAFRCLSEVDSKCLTDFSGAEKLNNAGDIFYKDLNDYSSLAAKIIYGSASKQYVYQTPLASKEDISDIITQVCL